ncbi:hypothetical protein NLJ89_g10356 [Agrocybe chaxingu]|uniref:Uncharacterized protein n=1 Tax=Agrocybe chaxingu TaxID=84603 RepID=A0A9W8MS78_9AGAR|nr:hypothetical protein NLJ89_g10356 [Agrocybe chaxingu]
MTRKKAKPSTDTEEIAERSMEFFMSTIRDPQKVAVHCGRCLYGALLLSTADPERPIDTPEKLPTSIRKDLEFWNLLLSFLVTPRTDKEVERLLTSFSRCYCHLMDPNIGKYHRAGQLAEAGSMNRTWMEYYAPPSEKSKYSTARCAFVIKGFTVLYSGLKEGGIKSVAKGVTHTWPATPADLMPFGADELVKTMLQWYRFVPDPMVVQLTTRILRTARYTLIPSLYKYRLAHTFVDHA